MKNIIKVFMLTLILCLILSINITNVNAVNQDVIKHTVVSGDSMWRIAVKYQVGLYEIISSNGHIKNPNLIYPGQTLNIPTYEYVKGIEREVINLVNVERQKNGLKAYGHNWELSRVARHKSNDMRDNNYFSHTSPTYGSPFTMMKNFGIRYSSAGENIAKGQKTAKDVVNSWMNSSGHRANILSSSFTEIGVGYAVDSKGTTYWTQMFIRP